MKDAMEVIRTQTRTLRISKTSIGSWTLYGPIDQALKTSIQAEAVRACSITVPVHGTPWELTLWVNGEDAPEGAPNPPAMIMLAVQHLRDKAVEQGVSFGGVSMVALPPNAPSVVGPAILTAVGGESLPSEIELDCLFSALMGQNSE